VMPSEEKPDRRNANDELLDAVNRRLLGELQTDGRLSLAELGRRVGLSAPAVGERLQRLQRAGVVRGYRAELDPAAVGFPLGVIIRVRPAAGELPKVAELARQTPEVVECHRITGEDCFFMKLHLRDVAHMEEVIDRFLLYGQTTTSIVQSSPVAARGLPLDPDGGPPSG
jgi:Lrp/AsnC family leucine-responsive transcriptional regulator